VWKHPCQWPADTCTINTGGQHGWVSTGYYFKKKGAAKLQSSMGLQRHERVRQSAQRVLRLLGEVEFRVGTLQDRASNTKCQSSRQHIGKLHHDPFATVDSTLARAATIAASSSGA
jgi:hypothetical protein